MPQQSYSNHKKYVPGFHYFLLLGVLLLLIGSIVNLITSKPENIYNAALLCFGSVLFSVNVFYTRIFPLAVQNRVIRAEENLRYYTMTGKTLPTSIRMSQIIALRFASDEEFVDLIDKCIKEQLSSKQIKESVKNWRGDYYRA